MAPFKILRGESSRISTSVTPFHDGYVYLTQDDGKFYIDSTFGGKNKRICINPDASKPVEVTLLKDGWNNSKQVLKIEGLTSETNGMIGLTHVISDTQLEAAKAAELYVYSQSENELIISARGEIPIVDIPVAIILLG